MVFQDRQQAGRILGERLKISGLQNPVVVGLPRGGVPVAAEIATMLHAHYLKDRGAQKVVLTVPICSPQTARSLRTEVDELICLVEPESFYSVGQFYANFQQISDNEVVSILSKNPSQYPNNFFTY